MSTSTVTTIRFLEVDSKPGAAKYVKIVEIPVDPNGPGYVAIINQAAGLDELPPPVPERAPVRVPKAGLDIDLGASTGTIAFAVRLPSFTSDSKLSFVSYPAEPVIALPSNFDPVETYLHGFMTHESKEPRWASFVCNVDAVKRSQLADRIRGAHFGSHEHGRKVMALPFRFNVMDHVLGCAPWMLAVQPLAYSDDPPVGGNCKTHGGAHPGVGTKDNASDLLAIFTHGGAHPGVGNFVMMDL